MIVTVIPNLCVWPLAVEFVQEIIHADVATCFLTEMAAEMPDPSSSIVYYTVID